MAFEGNTGLQVASQYGARETGNTAGVETTKTAFNILNIELTSEGLKNSFLPPLVIPKNAQIKRAFITVNTALTGVTGLSIGRGNAPATDGITLVAADLAVGSRDLTAKLTGEWAATSATTTANQIGILVTGAPTITTGRASLVIEYVYKTRNDLEFKAQAASKPVYKPQPV